VKSPAQIQPWSSDAKSLVPAKWQWHLHALLRLRQRLQGQAKEHLTAAEAPRKEDQDFAAQASDESEFENLIAEVHSEETLLAEIEAALERMRLGTYGICQVSGDPIPGPRLRAVPWTRYRLDVAASLEKKSLPPG
jgi:RNA polymerase-binding transcription factor DksA